jgi:APA family basic amino acid/polyamine antiporter
MFLQQLFAKKSLETLAAEAKGENRLRRVLGPISLTSLGVGAIIGAGIFVMTGRTAAVDAGPAVMLSYVVAGLGCAFAALCYAEFASTAPVAGSAYTYAYATLGELLAWIIGWDLILEYAMACAVVASGWTHYLNEFLKVFFNTSLPLRIASDPFTEPGAWFNLPSVAIMVVVTVVLVIGIRESATTNAVLVIVKLGVVLFVIGAGYAYVNRDNWTGIPVEDRLTPKQALIADKVKDEVKDHEKLTGQAKNDRIKVLEEQAESASRLQHKRQVTAQRLQDGKISKEQEEKALAEAEKRYGDKLPKSKEDRAAVDRILAEAEKEAPDKALAKWGLLGQFGLNRWLGEIDDRVRSPFAPYGFSGIMLGAALVFFAYIGFDSISTHAEEARKPHRDVPIGILASLAICTVLYIAVAAVITGMEPYPEIDRTAAVAAAFRHEAEQPGQQNSLLLKIAAGLIAIGALAGLTSVLLITFLSQARIFLAMARDGLLPPRVFGAIHPRFRTPHLSTMLTGAVICVVGAFTPIADLEEMVNIGTLMAFVIVCAAVLILRVKRPDVHRPFRCPAVYVIAPLGIAVNLLMMLFLPPITWLRLLGWLVVGLLIYFLYGMRNSVLGQQLRSLIPAFPGGVPSSDGLADKGPRLPASEDVKAPDTGLTGKD